MSRVSVSTGFSTAPRFRVDRNAAPACASTFEAVLGATLATDEAMLGLGGAGKAVAARVRELASLFRPREATAGTETLPTSAETILLVVLCLRKYL